MLHAGGRGRRARPLFVAVWARRVTCALGGAPGGTRSALDPHRRLGLITWCGRGAQRHRHSKARGDWTAGPNLPTPSSNPCMMAAGPDWLGLAYSHTQRDSAQPQASKSTHAAASLTVTPVLFCKLASIEYNPPNYTLNSAYAWSGQACGMCGQSNKGGRNVMFDTKVYFWNTFRYCIYILRFVKIFWFSKRWLESSLKLSFLKLSSFRSFGKSTHKLFFCKPF